jgi:uncharacterized protein YjcR
MTSSLQTEFDHLTTAFAKESIPRLEELLQNLDDSSVLTLEEPLNALQEHLAAIQDLHERGAQLTEQWLQNRKEALTLIDRLLKQTIHLKNQAKSKLSEVSHGLKALNKYHHFKPEKRKRIDKDA